MTLRLVVVYDCPTRMVAEYHLSDGRIFFCDFLRGKWFTEFNTAEATEAHIMPVRESPDLVWDGERLIVVEGTKG